MLAQAQPKTSNQSDPSWWWQNQASSRAWQNHAPQWWWQNQAPQWWNWQHQAPQQWQGWQNQAPQWWNWSNQAPQQWSNWQNQASPNWWWQNQAPQAWWNWQHQAPQQWNGWQNQAPQWWNWNNQSPQQWNSWQNQASPSWWWQNQAPQAWWNPAWKEDNVKNFPGYGGGDGPGSNNPWPANGWQNWNFYKGEGAWWASQGFAVKYWDNDTETTIECYIPGINAENCELTTFGNDVRIRLVGQENQGYINLSLPPYADTTRIAATAAKEVLKITVPTRAEITSNIKKFKPSKAK